MVNIAIWGAGRIAQKHISAFLELDNRCSIVAICNRHIETAKDIIQRNQLNAIACIDLAEAISKVHIDLVDIILPPFLHAKASCFAAEHGVHVLVEKPMANSLEECDQMIRYAKDNHILLSVVCQNRFTSEVNKIKQMLSGKKYGKIQFAQINSLWWRGQEYYQTDWRGKWLTDGGGVLTSQAIHDLDLMLYLLGKPLRVSAIINNISHPLSECEDTVMAVYSYSDYDVLFSASLVTHGEEKKIDIYTEKGRFSIPWLPAANKASDNGFPITDAIILNQMKQDYCSIPDSSYRFFAAQFDEILSAIEKDTSLTASSEDGRNVIEVISATYLSAKLKSPVYLPLHTNSPIYSLSGKLKLMSTKEQ